MIHTGNHTLLLALEDQGRAGTRFPRRSREWKPWRIPSEQNPTSVGLRYLRKCKDSRNADQGTVPHTLPLQLLFQDLCPLGAQG